jgi:hypothetical protein
VLKKKTLRRLQTVLDEVIPKKKLDAVYGSGNSAALKKQLIGYCSSLLLYGAKNKISFRDWVETRYNGQRRLGSNELLTIRVVRSGKDGIHFKITYDNYFLDYEYDCRMATIREREKESRYQRQQFKYAARQNRRKK